MKIYISILKEDIEVDSEGKFELPSREYTTAELKKIAHQINKTLRLTTTGENYENNIVSEE